MNHATKISQLPELTAHLLRDGGCLIDNLFADLWTHMSMKARLNRLGFHKRSGTPVHELVYCLMIWVWLKVDSIGMFSRESLKTFSRAEKDALYGVLNHEDKNWRRLHMEIARQALGSAQTPNRHSAFVLDDTIQVRYGKKMPGVSSHFDHSSGRHVMGQQVLTLGLSSADGFVPIDSELFISATRAQGLHQPFHDGRSIAAKRYRLAQQQSKPQMAADMIRRAQRAGIEARYLLADAWFGSKAIIRLAGEQLLTPILRMKKNTMKYRLSENRAGHTTQRELPVNALYQTCIRSQWQNIPGQPYQAKALDVELNLSSTSEHPDQWIRVRLLFVRGIAAAAKAQPGKHDWAVFLTTDTQLEPQRILQLYAMRWAIEVYFKETKQYLGFLKEQSNHYAAYIASIHLAAMRFCMLVIAKSLHPASAIADMRQQITANATSIDYATRLWHTFRAVITGALEDMSVPLGDIAPAVLETIERHMQNFFVQALQLDAETLRMEANKSIC